MNYDSFHSDTVVRAVDRRQQRRSREVCESFTCISPWFILRRWIAGGKSNRSAGRNWGNVKRKLGILNGFGNDDPPSPSADVSEIGKDNASFNLGVGFGLMYLVAASRNEINKMVELHKEIEILLRNLRTEIFQNQKSRISSSFSNTAVEQTVRTEEHDSGLYLSSRDVQVQCVQIGIVSDRIRREKTSRMDQIEAELEAEFDSLQVQMDEEFFMKYSKQKHSEIKVEERAPEWSLNTCYEEQTEHHNNEYYCVPPRELERKLHELLEAQQQERINELETSLDCAMQQLEVKEREIGWWKDTARLIARRLPPIPNLVRQVKQSINGRLEQEINVREMSRSMVMNSLFETKYENLGQEL